MKLNLIDADVALRRSAYFYGVLFLVYFTSFVFEGALRYALSEAGAANFLYLRDLIPIFFILTGIFVWMHGISQPTILLVVFLLLSIHFFIGYFYLKTFFQQLFGYKVFLPFLLGLSVGSLMHIDNKKLYIFSFSFLSLAIIGVVASYFVKLPWEGAEYETAFGILSQSRDWTASGVRRLAGFSRSSFDVASVILVTMVVCMVVTKSRFVGFIIWIISMLAIVATTSKGALMAAIVFGIVYVFYSYVLKSYIWFWSLGLLLLLMCLFPLFSLVIDVSVEDMGEVSRVIFSSFVVRMSSMWPEAFSNLFDHGNLLFGRGVGGIGVSQNYGEWRLANAGDNFFVYLTVTFGFVGWMYLAWLYVKLLAFPKSVCRETYVLTLGLSLVIFAYGLTLNIIEQPILAIVLGAIVARLSFTGNIRGTNTVAG